MFKPRLNFDINGPHKSIALEFLFFLNFKVHVSNMFKTSLFLQIGLLLFLPMVLTHKSTVLGLWHFEFFKSAFGIFCQIQHCILPGSQKLKTWGGGGWRVQPPRGPPWVSGLVGHFVQIWPDSECSHTVQCLDCSDLNWRCNRYHLFWHGMTLLVLVCR